MSTEAMKLALEALNSFPHRHLTPLVSDARTALREALAQPQQEPVEYWTVANGWVSDQAEVPAAVWVEPDFWEHCNRVNCGTAYRLPAPGRQPLYTSPPAQRKPLTERELMKCITQAKCFDTVKMTYESGPYEIDRPTLKAFEFARAIEAAHGIKEST